MERTDKSEQSYVWLDDYGIACFRNHRFEGIVVWCNQKNKLN